VNYPDYHFLPAPLWLITILHVLTLALHFAAMNFLFGGLAVIVFGRAVRKWQDESLQTYVKLLPAATAATVTLGVAPLLFVQLVYGKLVYAASITSAWLWLFIFVAVIAAYYLLYGASLSPTIQRRKRLLPFALVALFYVSFVYSTVFSMSEHPDVYRALYAHNQSGAAINPDAASWVLRWVHMVIGAITVGGFFVGLVGRNSETAWPLGRGFFLGGTVASILVGGAYLISLGDALQPFIHSPGIAFVTAGFLLTVISVYLFWTRRFVLAGTLVFLSLLCMAAARHVLRLIYLRGTFDPGAVVVAPQWGVFAVFLVCFVAALGLVAWMLALFFRGRAQAA
jgi:hypothetical protein